MEGVQEQKGPESGPGQCHQGHRRSTILRQQYTTRRGMVRLYARRYASVHNTSRRHTIEIQGCSGKMHFQRSKIWDQNPQQGLGFDHIKYEEDFWIAPTDGYMTKYTADTKTPRTVFDKICTQVRVKEKTDTEEQKVEVKTVSGPSDSGGDFRELTGLTLCLRPFKG